MAVDFMKVAPVGDKRNSDFFNEYRPKIYERRRSSGIDDLLGNLRGIVIQVQTGDAIPHLEELYTMSPYRFDGARLNTTHRIFFLRITDEQPRLIVMEPLSPDYEDDITRFNMLYPRARSKPNARYVGEIFETKDLKETVKVWPLAKNGEEHGRRHHEGGACRR